MPDLYKVAEDGKIAEGFMDLVIRAPANPRTRYIDVTIKCPHRKGKDNSRCIGIAADTDDGDKSRRYGEQVMPISIESNGRMGAESRYCLRQLAFDASIVQTRSACNSAADIYSEWCVKLERAVLVELANITLCCLQRWATRADGA